MLRKILMDKPTNNSHEVGLKLTKIAGIAIVFSIYLLIGFYVLLQFRRKIQKNK